MIKGRQRERCIKLQEITNLPSAIKIYQYHLNEQKPNEDYLVWLQKNKQISYIRQIGKNYQNVTSTAVSIVYASNQVSKTLILEQSQAPIKFEDAQK